MAQYAALDAAVAHVDANSSPMSTPESMDPDLLEKAAADGLFVKAALLTPSGAAEAEGAVGSSAAPSAAGGVSSGSGLRTPPSRTPPFTRPLSSRSPAGSTLTPDDDTEEFRRMKRPPGEPPSPRLRTSRVTSDGQSVSTRSYGRWPRVNSGDGAEDGGQGEAVEPDEEEEQQHGVRVLWIKYFVQEGMLQDAFDLGCELATA